MTSALKAFIAETDRLIRSIDPKKQIQSSAKRAQLSSHVEKYFGQLRPILLSKDQQLPEARGADEAFQQLLPLCHARAVGSKYRTLLARAKSSLMQLEVAALTGPAQSGSRISAREQLILKTLEALLPSASRSYQQALEDLGGPERLSYRGPATDLRETFRETLDHLAPDSAVRAQAGFKLEDGANGPTMKQKVRFIMRSRGSASASVSSTESAASSIEESMGAFVRSVYTRSSVSTHVATGRSEVMRVKALVDVVLSELLEIE